RWAIDSLDAYRPLMEQLAGALGADAGGPDDLPGDDPMAGMLAGMMKMVQPMLLAMTAGSMVGHLARRSLGQYDLPIPRPATGARPDELLLVVPNLDEFADEWSIAKDEL